MCVNKEGKNSVLELKKLSERNLDFKNKLIILFCFLSWIFFLKIKNDKKMFYKRLNFYKLEMVKT